MSNRSGAMTRHVRIVDVFTDKPLSGNQLAVVLDDHVAGVEVGVNEAVLEAHLEHRAAHDIGELGVAAAVR